MADYSVIIIGINVRQLFAESHECAFPMGHKMGQIELVIVFFFPRRIEIAGSRS